jgi:hypothetical protein
MTKARIKEIEKETIDTMKETIGYFRDAEQNADAFHSVNYIHHNMNNYFGGMAIVLQKITGKEYHWGNDEKGYYIISYAEDKETVQYYI